MQPNRFGDGAFAAARSNKSWCASRVQTVAVFIEVFKLSTYCRMVKYRPQDVSVQTTGWAGTDDLDVQKMPGNQISRWYGHIFILY